MIWVDWKQKDGKKYIVWSFQKKAGMATNIKSRLQSKEYYQKEILYNNLKMINTAKRHINSTYIWNKQQNNKLFEENSW